LDDYLKAVDLVTLNEENKLRMKIEKLEVEKSEVQELALELRKVKQKIGM
jgi:hypothetical protein